MIGWIQGLSRRREPQRLRAGELWCPECRGRGYVLRGPMGGRNPSGGAALIGAGPRARGLTKRLPCLRCGGSGRTLPDEAL